MKKRQLLIYMLVGSLVFASTPMVASAEEAVSIASETSGTVSESSESAAASAQEAPASEPAAVPAAEPAEVPTDVPTETPTQAPTEVPTETPTDVPTQAPTDVPAEAPTDVPTQAPTDIPTEAPTETPSATPTETPVEIPADDFTAPTEPVDNGGINAVVLQGGTTTAEDPSSSVESEYPFYIGDAPYETLADALSAVPDSENVNDSCTQIEIKTAEWKLNETIVIPEKKNICLVAGVDTVTISRAEGFTGELFHVNGGVLNFATGELLKENGTVTVETKLIIDGSVSDPSVTEIGSLVSVESGIFGMNDNVTLQNCNASGNGAAIYNSQAGIVYLLGGTISRNTTKASGGGIYSEGVLYVKGNPVVKDNTGAESAKSNIVLKGSQAAIIVAGALGENADLSVQVLEALEGSAVVSIWEQVLDVTMADVLAAITYEGAGFTLDENGALKTVEADDSNNGSDNTDGEERDPIISDVNASQLSGLEEAKYFYPASERGGSYTYYNFSVKGAGTDITEPISGDVKWEPVYWSYSEAPSDSEKSTTWTVGTEQGIAAAGTQKLYVFFDKYEYDGSAWQAANETQSVAFTYQTLSLFYLNGVSCTWRSQTEADVTFRTNKAAKYYVEAVVKDSAQPSPVESNFIDMAADTDLTITVGDLKADTQYDIYVYAIDKDGGIVSGMKFQPKESSRPADTTTREPYTPAVTESVVTGLENALQFYPNTFYSFTVKGAGTDNTEPVEGDEKWVPVYWSTSSNPSNSQKHTTWKIGAAAGISQAATYNMYVFYQKYYYNGTKWVVTDTIKSVAYQFKSAEIEITVTPDNTNNGSSGYYDEDGNYVPGGSSEGAQDQIGTTTDTGAATSTGAVNTADNAPVGSLFAMMAAALSAMCCTITRKRKKNE